jgi:hypothetical protein
MRMSRIALLCLAVCLLVAAPAQASKSQAVTFEGPRDLLQPGARAAALSELDGFGIRSLRVVLTWHDVAPGADSPTKPSFEATDPSAYSWGEYDKLLGEAKLRGWDVTLTISGPVPKWATAVRRDTVTRPDASAFAAFATAVGRHYGPSVSTWSIWNEPNQPQFLRPQFSRGRAASPAIYRNLYRAGVRGLEKAGQGNETILLGETSPRGTGKVVAPLTFLRGTLCLDGRYRKRKGCGALKASGYAHHAYTTRQGPFFRPPGRNDVTIGVLSRLTRVLDRARSARALTGKLPLYLTEFGVQSFPDQESGVSLQQQVEFRATAERIAYENPRVRAFSQYLLRDSDPTGPKQYGGFESGLRFADGRPKPSLAAFPLTLSALRTKTGKVSLWGVIRPAKGAVDATITYRDRGSSREKALKTVRTDARGYFRLTTANRKDRRWNVSYAGRKGTPVRALRRP